MLVATTSIISCKKSSDELSVQLNQYKLFKPNSTADAAGVVTVTRMSDGSSQVIIQLDDNSRTPNASLNAYITTTGREGESDLPFASLNNVNGTTGYSETHPVLFVGTTNSIAYDDLTSRMGLTLVIKNQDIVVATANMSK